ncbi:hypothetical protein [Actinokineospora sp. HUAS TT18]|uniref:hypothetical protein n=1 Tax=Actinokineospora sp. HUAS TT18 TaxID=3447451 RepID=UPI003F521175
MPGEVFIGDGEPSSTSFDLRRGVLKPDEIVNVTVYTSGNTPTVVSSAVVLGPDPQCEFVDWTFGDGPATP